MILIYFSLEFGVRQCVRFRSLPVQPELAIVFQLIYLVACPSSKNEVLFLLLEFYILYLFFKGSYNKYASNSYCLGCLVSFC